MQSTISLRHQCEPPISKAIANASTLRLSHPLQPRASACAPLATLSNRNTATVLMLQGSWDVVTPPDPTQRLGDATQPPGVESLTERRPGALPYLSSGPWGVGLSFTITICRAFPSALLKLWAARRKTGSICPREERPPVQCHGLDWGPPRRATGPPPVVGETMPPGPAPDWTIKRCASPMTCRFRGATRITARLTVTPIAMRDTLLG